MLTSDEYKGCGGAVCPVCGSNEITGGDTSIDLGSASQEVECCKCGSAWYDCYSLVGYMDLTIGDKVQTRKGS